MIVPTEEEFQEQLKNMTPEQIRELQKQQCIFCKIVAKQVQAKTVYEDEQFIAVLDINPGTPGHLLVMPKEHYSILPQLPEDVITHLGMLAKHLSQSTLRGIKAQGTTIFVANGVAAGQRASHFLLHVIPRMDGDGAGMTLPEVPMSEADVAKLQGVLQPFVNRALGKIDSTPAEKHARIANAEATKIPGKKSSGEENAPLHVAHESSTDISEHKKNDSATNDDTSNHAGKKVTAESVPTEKQKTKGKFDLDAITDLLSGGK